MPTPGPKLNLNQKPGDLGCLTRTLEAEVEWREDNCVPDSDPRDLQKGGKERDA